MCQRWGREEHGSSLVEMALVSLFLIMLLAGAIDFGWAFHDFIILQNASREGARTAVRYPCRSGDSDQRSLLRAAIIEAVKNEAVNSGVELSDSDVSIRPNPLKECPAVGAPFVVEASYEYRTMMGGILGMASVSMRAETSMPFFGNDQ